MRAAVAGSGDRTLPPVLPVFPQEYTVDIPENRGSETVCRMEVTAAQRAARDKIAAGLALPGALTVRAYRCGKARAAAALTRPACGAAPRNKPPPAPALPAPLPARASGWGRARPAAALPRPACTARTPSGP